MNTEEVLERAIAYHEAAHAIFAHSMALDVVKLSVIPDATAAGGCEVDRESYFLKNIKNCRNATIELIIFFLAGKIAERRYLLDKFPTPDTVLKSSSILDDQEIEEMISINNVNGEDLIDLDELYKTTNNIVNTPHIWLMIQSVADDLFHAKILVGKQLDQTLNSFEIYDTYSPNLGC